MHEGLIVLSESNMQLRFASKPAIQLLNSDKSNELKKQITHSLEKSLQNDNAFDQLNFGDAHMNKRLFIPTKASMYMDYNDVKAIDKEDEQETQHSISLNSIIKNQLENKYNMGSKTSEKIISW